MGISRLEFLLFYSIFLIAVVFISGMAGVTIFGDSVEGLAEFPVVTGAWWEIITVPVAILGFFAVFLTVSSEFLILFTLILIPFIIGMGLLIAEMLRGN